MAATTGWRAERIPLIHGESSRDGAVGISAAPSTSGERSITRFVLAATTATAIAAAIFGLSVVTRDADSPLSDLGAVDSSFFPDVAVVGGADAASRARLRDDWNANHAGGFDAVRVVPALDLRAWPEGGDYGHVFKLIRAELGDADLAIAELDDDQTQARVITEAEEKDILDVDEVVEDASKSLQHLLAMLDARVRKSPALVVADRDASISALGGAFAHAHVGRPEEFDSVLLSFLYKGPKKWDVLWCDKGQGGVSASAAAHPALVMRNDKWVGEYEVYAWTGEDGMSGSGLYAVSGSFLERLPKTIKESRNPFDDVGAWLAETCRSGEAACFSYLEKKTSRSDSKLAALGGRTAGRFSKISWRDTEMQAAGAAEASSGALAVGGETVGDSKALSAKGVDAESARLGKKQAETSVSKSSKKSSTFSSKRVSSKPSSSKRTSSQKASKKDEGLGKKESGGEAAPVVPFESTSNTYSKTPKSKSRSASVERAHSVEHHQREESLASSGSINKGGKKVSIAGSESETKSKRSTETKSSPSSKSSREASKSSREASKSSQDDISESDVDSMLDWWSDTPQKTPKAAAGSNAKSKSKSQSARSSKPEPKPKSKSKSKSTRIVADAEEDKEVSDALNGALESASASLLAGSTRKAAPPGRRSSVVRLPSPGSASSPSRIETSPVLEREGEWLPDDPENLERQRLVSRQAAKGDERDMRLASAMTDAVADARAERRVGGLEISSGTIKLHTISPEEALKYVSRVHHKEEVEAAEAAAELAKQEAAQKKREAHAAVSRGDALLNAADASYEDIIEDSYEDIVSERESRRSWSAVGERERSTEAAYHDEGEDEKVYDAKGKTSTSESSFSKHVRRPPTLKKSPHAVDARAERSSGSSPASARDGRAGRADRSRSRTDPSTLGEHRSVFSETPAVTSRVEAREAAKAAEARSEVPAAPAEMEAGGAWRSAYTEAQTHASYATRAKAVFDPAAGPVVGGRSAAALGNPVIESTKRRIDETEIAALVAAADSSLGPVR